MMRGARLFVAIAALSVVACVSARADVFDFSYTGTGISASGTLTATLQSGDQYLITNITGTYNGAAITGLLPVGYKQTDDLLYPANDSPTGSYLTSYGFDYTVSGTSEQYRPFSTGTNTYSQETDINGSYLRTDPLSSFTLTPSAVPAPIPGTGALSYLIVLLGGAWRWRRTKITRARQTARSALHSLRTLYRGIRSPAPVATRAV